jgi:hypothetical protein
LVLFVANGDVSVAIANRLRADPPLLVDDPSDSPVI